MPVLRRNKQTKRGEPLRHLQRSSWKAKATTSRGLCPQCRALRGKANNKWGDNIPLRTLSHRPPTNGKGRLKEASGQGDMLRRVAVV